MHRSLVMPGIAVLKEVQVPGRENIRAISPGDLEAVARLLNETWRGHDLFEPTSVASLAGQIEQIAALDYSDVLVFEDQGRILACAALELKACLLIGTLRSRVVCKHAQCYALEAQFQKGITETDLHCIRAIPLVPGIPLTDREWGGALSEAIRVPFAEAMLVPAPAGVPAWCLAAAGDNASDGWRCVAPHLAARPGAPVLVLAGIAPSVSLYAAEQDGLVKIISSPRVITQDNLGASIQSGVQMIIGFISFKSMVNCCSSASLSKIFS